MDQTFGIIISAISLIGGVLLLTGNGGFLMGGGNAEERKKIYNLDKVERASGIAFLVVGIASVIDLFTTGLLASIIYLVVVIGSFTALFVYMRKKCMK